MKRVVLEDQAQYNRVIKQRNGDKAEKHFFIWCNKTIICSYCMIVLDNEKHREVYLALDNFNKAVLNAETWLDISNIKVDTSPLRKELGSLLVKKDTELGYNCKRLGSY